jgi:hypothetical protein
MRRKDNAHDTALAGGSGPQVHDSPLVQIRICDLRAGQVFVWKRLGEIVCARPVLQACDHLLPRSSESAVPPQLL